MAKTIFEQIGGTYTQVGDYYLPNLKLPEEEKQANIGLQSIKWTGKTGKLNKKIFFSLIR